MITDHGMFVRQFRALGKAYRGIDAGIRKRHDKIDIGRRFVGQLPAHLLAANIDLFIKHT